MASLTLGEPQALLIQSMLHKEVSGVDQKRRIQAGISGEFQGDERDIMFLSMGGQRSHRGAVACTGEGAFELIKKRYNVAASRARDQMWAMHSFDPDLHLRTADIRLKLLQHVRDPLASLRAYNQEVGRTESPFERDVLKRLTDAGYQVKSQWQVGYFRIDMVGLRALEAAGCRMRWLWLSPDGVAKTWNASRSSNASAGSSSGFAGAPSSATELSMRPVFDRLGRGIPPEAATTKTRIRI